MFLVHLNDLISPQANNGLLHRYCNVMVMMMMMMMMMMVMTMMTIWEIKHDFIAAAKSTFRQF